MNASIFEAIEQRKLISATYDGQPRILEPHCYGESRTGNELLRSFQTKGGSNSDKCPDWKLMSVRKMENLTILDQGFTGTRPGYNPDGDQAMNTIYINL